MRRLSTQTTGPRNSQPPARLLNVQVALKCSEHTEHEGTIQHADEEAKSLAV